MPTIPKSASSLRAFLATSTIVNCLIAGAAGGWITASGIQPGLWPTNRVITFALAGTAVLLAWIATAGAISFFRSRITDIFTRFLCLTSFAALLLVVVLGAVVLNIRLDSAQGEPVELKITDLFALQVQRRDMKAPFIQHYAAFSVPQELRTHALMLLSQENAGSCTVGQTIRVVMHPGRFAMPWYEFVNTVDGAINQSLDSTFRNFQVLSASGTFAQGSAYREQLQARSVPILQD
mgnify:CR=1 FL=1